MLEVKQVAVVPAVVVPVAAADWALSPLAFNAVTEEFLAKYLGGRYEPPNEDENKLLASNKQ